MQVTKQQIIDYLISQKTFYAQKYNIEQFGLFGSFARNEQSENSDIDIVYILKENKNIDYFKLYELQKELENEFSRKVELINYRYLNPIIKYKSEKDIIYA